MTRSLVVAVLILLLGSPAFAQFETASLVGTLRDKTGAVVAGAKVTVTNAGTGVSAEQVSSNEGNYEFFTLRPGTYVVTAERTGFSLALVDNVAVQVGARQRVDIVMAVGQVTEKVEVRASGLGLETDSSQRGGVVNGDEMRQLAMNGREYSSLALLVPGVRQSALNKPTNSTPREGAFNVNGLRSVFNNFLIDGVDNNAYGTSNQGFSNQVMQPSPDAVDEFRVVTNNPSAEYGRAAGATVNVAYRSGTNRFSGSAWQFHRDTRLNAQTYFKPADGSKAPLRRNQFGGVVGGPILKNRAFFFVDYEGFRQDRRSVVFSTLPTPAQKAGILTVDVRDPRTGAVYPAGTAIPMTSFARQVLAGLPDPNLSSAANNYQVLQQFTQDSDKAGVKLDITVSPKLSVFGRYGGRNLETFDQPSIPLPSGGGGNGTIYARNGQVVLGATYAATPRSLLEVRLGRSVTEGGKNPPALGSPSAFDEYGLTGLPSDPRIAGGLPAQSVGGLSAFGRQATNPQWQYPTLWNPKANYTWLMGRHSLKAGYEYQHVAIEVQDVNPLYGLDSYTGNLSRPSGVASNNVYNLSDFMLGLRSQYALSTLFVAKMRQDLHFGYLQDDVRVNNRLTVNLGVRYEYGSPLWEQDNRLTNFDPATNTMVAASAGSVASRALVNPDRNNFAPRLGAAFTLTPTTVICGGYGVSYVHFNRIGSANILAINGPQVVRAVVNQTDATAASFRPTEQGYPAGLTDPAGFVASNALVSYIDKDFHASPVQSWHVSVQKQVMNRLVLDVAFVGNKATDLLYLANYNQATVNNAAGSQSLASRRPIPGFGDITYVFNGGKSDYRAFQTTAEWRSTDLTLRTALTLSEARDNGAGALENQNGNFPGPQDFRNMAADYALSGYHQPYNSATTVVYSLPFGRGKRWGSEWPAALEAVLGGWQMSGIYTLTPGENVTLTYSPVAALQVSGITNDFSGANNYRPNVVCDPYASSDTQTITNWFNPACVVIPTDPSNPFGDAARNSVRGPNFRQFDFAAIKRVSLTGAAQVELRVEAFNLFNRTNFAPPNGNRSAAGFGQITGAYDARQVQLGAKFLW